jgi:hypothetical protein
MSSSRLFASRYRLALALALLAVGMSVALAGCNELGATTTSETKTTEGGVTSTVATDMPSTTTEVSAGPTTTIKVDASEELMANGHITACGIITEVWMDGSTRKLKIDYVDFLTGDAAVSAAVADGEISEGDYIEYYARNKNTKLRSFTVSDSVLITTYSRVEPIDVSDPECSWGDFYDFWNLVGPPLPGDMGLSEGLWWIERDGTGIVAIEQQWVP